jgi:acyl carrier protein
MDSTQALGSTRLPDSPRAAGGADSTGSIGADDGPHSTVGVIRGLLIDTFGVFGTDGIGVDTTFESLDIDSLVLVELAVLLERRFGVQVPEGELTAEQTIAEAAALVDAKRGLDVAA